MATAGRAGAFRFGKFVFNPYSRELYKGNTRLRVPDQSLSILAMLLERPGQVVTREEIQERLWPHGTVVEFEHSVNSAMKRLREALSDSAVTPRYIETLPKRGYRFVAELQPAAGSPAISNYRILGEAGRGAMGIVYRADDLRLGRQVALKVLPPELSRDPQRKARLIREARAASALNHPNIVTVYDVGSEDGCDFIVMEYVAGKPLSELIPGQGMPLADAVRIAVQIADALVVAHASGIVHRDLKPGNILVSDEGKAKLLDFGLAKFTEGDGDGAGQARTSEGAVMGTTGYMSPEQAEGKPVDARSDIFSFGSVLYEMVTGRRAFERDSNLATLAAILHDDPPPPSQITAGIPPDLERAILRCLRKESGSRWQTMSELKAALENLVGDSSGTGGIVSRPGPAVSHRRAWLWWVAGGVILTAGAVAGLWFASAGRPGGALLAGPFTYDSGFAGMPAISRDGKLVAYVSDGGGDSADIWLLRIDGRRPVQLTHEEGGARWPCFSADGSRVFYCRNGRHGGIFSIDTLGSDRRMVVDSGTHPRVSPDGSTIVYFTTGAPWYTGKMFTVPAQGGAPLPFQPAFSLDGALYETLPVWAPDSKHILFPGVRDDGKGEADWYVGEVSPNAREAVATGFGQNAGLAEDWLGDYVYYSTGTVPDGINLYRVRIAQDTWRISGAPERLTSGPGQQSFASIADDGRMVYASFNYRAAIWSVPVDLSRGTIAAEPRQLTNDEMAKLGPAVSRDGTKVAFVAWGGIQRPRLEVRLQNLAGGAERVYAAKSNATDIFLNPCVSRDGSLLAWVEGSATKKVSYLVKAGAEETSASRVCAGCRVLGFSSRGDLLVLYEDHRLVRQMQDSKALEPLVAVASDASIVDGALSPDDAWLALQVQRADGSTAIQLARVRASTESDWVTLAAGSDFLACPRWSSDGRLVYYLSDRDGYACIWAQRIDAITKKPAGAPFAVLHEHKARYQLDAPRPAARFDVAKGWLVYFRAEVTGNVWMTKVDLGRPRLFGFR